MNTGPWPESRSSTSAVSAQALLDLAAKADVLLDCFRPGAVHRRRPARRWGASLPHLRNLRRRAHGRRRLEPQVCAQLLAELERSVDDVPGQLESDRYDEMRAVFTERFASRTRDEWTVIFAETDACTTPVLNWTEAATNEHLLAGVTVADVDGVQQAGPAPSFS